MAIERDELGRWKKGTDSPHPEGREPGPSKVARLREQLIGAFPNVLKAMYDKAMSGDALAAKLIAERCMPALKATDLALAVPLSLGTLSEQGHDILRRVADGELSPEVAGQLLSNVATVQRVIEADELVARIAALEKLAREAPR